MHKKFQGVSNQRSNSEVLSAYLLTLSSVESAQNNCGFASPSDVDGIQENRFPRYRNIFRRGNRNAASHLWAKFLLDRADQMTDAKLKEMSY